MKTTQHIAALPPERRARLLLLAHRAVDASRNASPDIAAQALADLASALNPAAIAPTSERKRAASRANGTKGGRPRKQQN